MHRWIAPYYHPIFQLVDYLAKDKRRQLTRELPEPFKTEM
jgi:hypothetical protein